MNKIVKVSLYVVGLIAVVVIAGVTYIKTSFPKIGPAPDLTIEATPERIARGKYLAYHVVGCMDCHSTRDWNKFAGPLILGTEGKGGDKFDEETMDFPGTLYAANITPTNLKDWTDGEIYRLITTGVKKDGEPIFPMMPYQAYGKMDPEDVYSIISFIRTLSPKEGAYPTSKLNFPLNLIVRTIPKEADPMERPSPSDTVKHGEYLVTIAACVDCHTPSDKGTPLPGMNFAGGMEFKFPNGDVVRSANITQSKETGIGLWSEEVFLSRFKAYRDSAAQNIMVSPHQMNSVMPWILMSGMTDGDLISIYRYLKTILPIENKVEKFTVKSE